MRGVRCGPVTITARAGRVSKQAALYALPGEPENLVVQQDGAPVSRLTLATRIGLEPYLLGVVPGEIGALRDSLLEAGRAQAIAARSYSLFYRGRRGAEGFDLYATVEDQLYSPVESERPLATRCVEGTRGIVCMADARPIRANWVCSSSFAARSRANLSVAPARTVDVSGSVAALRGPAILRFLGILASLGNGS